MNPKSFRSLLIALAILALASSACNNPNATATNRLTGDRTWAQTTLDAAEKCAKIGLEVLGINPDNGDPTCGTIAISIPVSGETSTTPGGVATCISDDSVTNFPERELLVVNGVSVGLQVRDANCPRATYHDETGVAKGAQYKITVPEGWSIAFAAVSCEVVKDGGSPVQYLETPFILIQGPWSGQLGCYEAGVHGLPSEWESYLTSVIKPIHDSEVGHVVPLTIITGN